MQSHKRPHELSDNLLKNLFEAEAFKHQHNLLSVQISEPLYYSNSFCCQPVFFNAFKQLDNSMLEASLVSNKKEEVFNSPTSLKESRSAAVHSILSGELVNSSFEELKNAPDRYLAPEPVEAYYTQN